MTTVDMGEWYAQVGKEEIGRGATGTVYKAYRVESQSYVAIKVLDSSTLDNFRLQQEIDILQKCGHVNIVKYIESYEYKGKVFIAMELCDTTLYRYLMDRRRLNQKQAAYFIYQVLKALNHLHTRLKVVHRDVKLSNVLLKYESPTSEPVVKLCDFGLVAPLHPDNEQLTYCGTTSTMAPEVTQNKSQTYARDMWSVGILFFYLIKGHAPFARDTEEETIRAINRGIYDRDGISKEGLAFLDGLLQVNPEMRMTAKQALQHSLFESEALSIHSQTSDFTPSRRRKDAQPSQKDWFSTDHRPLGSPYSASSNVATPIASYNAVHRLHSGLSDTSSYSRGANQQAAGGRTENIYADNGRRMSGEWMPLGHPSEYHRHHRGRKSSKVSDNSSSGRSSGSSVFSGGSGAAGGGGSSRVNKGNRISIDQLPMMFSEELVLDEVVGQEEPAEALEEPRSLTSYEKTAALLGLSEGEGDTLNSRSELTSVDVVRRLQYSDTYSESYSGLRGPTFDRSEPRAAYGYSDRHGQSKKRGGGASRRYQSEVSEYGSDEDRSAVPGSAVLVTPPTVVTKATQQPLLVIQKGGHTQYFNSTGTYYDDAAAVLEDRDDPYGGYSSAAYDLREEFNQPLEIIRTDECEEVEEPALAEVEQPVKVMGDSEAEVPIIVEPTDAQLQAYHHMLSMAETIQAKRFLLQPLVFATTEHELLMISSPLPTGKMVDVGGCVGDLLYCVPLPADKEGSLPDAVLGLFVTAKFHELDGTNETIVCQKILTTEEVAQFRELYVMQDNSNVIVAQHSDPMVNSLYFQNRIVDCDWKSRYHGLNCPLLNSEMWIEHRVTAAYLDSDSVSRVLTSLDRLCTVVDAIGAVVNRIIVKYRPDPEQITSASRRLERIKAEFTLMSNDDVRPMFRMRWTNGMNLAANLATNKLSFMRTKRPLLEDGSRSTTEVDIEEWSGLCSLHHCDYPELPAGLPLELPNNLVKYVMMAISAVGMCLHEVRAKECSVKDCELLNGNVRLLTCTKFDEIY